MKMSRLFPIVVTLALFLVSNDLVYGQKKAETGLPVVYNDVSQGATKLDADAKKIYGGKFRVRDVTNKDGFSRSQIKGREMDIADPRGAREREKPDKVVGLSIVNAD